MAGEFAAETISASARSGCEECWPLVMLCQCFVSPPGREPLFLEDAKAACCRTGVFQGAT